MRGWSDIAIEPDPELDLIDPLSVEPDDVDPDQSVSGVE
jgi:hypothetical protein